MKDLFLCLIVVFFIGCSTQQKPQNQTLELEKAIAEIQTGEKTSNISQSIFDDAQMLLDRSYAYGYKLINGKTLLQMNKEKQVVLIDTSPKGQYLLKHLEGAKHFEFNSTFLSSDGILIWNTKNESQQEFLSKIGNNLFVTLVFYDQTQTPSHQVSPADIASMWAKKLGYHNVYRLVGNPLSWKSQGLKTTNETPKCCQ